MPEDILKALLVCVFITVSSLNASACDCMPATFNHALSGSDAVFSGKAVKVRYLDDAKKVAEPRITVTFDVYQAWKGPAQKEITLNTVYNTWTCKGFSFQENGEYLVFAHKQKDETLDVARCTRTRPLSLAQEDLKILGPGTVMSGAKK